MGLHRTFNTEFEPSVGGCVRIEGDEAQHAVRVKRLGEGEPIEVLTGRGVWARGTIEEIRKEPKPVLWSLTVRFEEVERVRPIEPVLEICSAVPKGPRLESMIDQLVQAGCSAWRPLRSKRSVVDPRAGKLARLERVVAEASKQCGRAWSMRLEPGLAFEDALVDAGESTVLVGDASGEPLEPALGERTGPIRVLIGPEGGWTDAEREQAESAGARRVRLGPAVMRLETAAVVAAGVLLSRSVGERVR